MSIEYNKYIDLVSRYNKFEDFYKENQEFFSNTWYKHQPIDKIGMRYLNYLSVSYNVKTPQGIKVPYMPVSWQIDYHLNSLLLKQDNVKDDFIMKGRGISYSYSTMVEAINVGSTYPNTIIPVMAHRKQAAQDIVNVARWLSDNANIDIQYNKTKESELEIYTKYGKSIIRPYPTGSPQAAESIRSLRPVLAVIDEAGVIRNLQELIVAVKNSMQTKQTKVVIGGTPKGKTNHFWKMHSMNLTGYNKYFLPGFEGVVTTENIRTLKPIVWWYDMDKLTDNLINDPDGFSQEIMASPYNDTEALIPLIDIESSADHDFNLELVTNWYIIVGIDIATLNDYAVITAFKTNGIYFQQIYLKYYKGVLLDDFQKYCENVIQELDPTEVRVDCTGIGMQMAQNLVSKYSSKIKMVNFASNIKFGQEHMSIKKYMLLNLQYLFTKGVIGLSRNDLQTSHLASINKSLNMLSKDGHNDIAIAIALALMPLNFRYNPQFREVKPIENKTNSSELFNIFKQAQRQKMQDFGGFKVV